MTAKPRPGRAPGRRPLAERPSEPEVPRPPRRRAPARGRGRGAVAISVLVHAGLAVAALLAPEPTPEADRTLHFTTPARIPDREPEPEEEIPPPPPAPPERVPVLVEEELPEDAVEPRSDAATVGVGSAPSWREVMPAVRLGPPTRGRGGESAAEAPAPAAPAAAPRPAGPSRRASLLEDGFEEPVYPSLARSRGVEGRVVLLLSVRTDGTVSAVEIATSSGSELLDDAAREAALRWRFEPALVDGEPAEDRLRLAVRFSLDDA